MNTCKVPLPLCTAATTKVRLIRLCVAKTVNRATSSKRYVLQLPLSPRLVECLHVMLLAPGQLSAMMSSSLHHLQKVFLLLLSSNRYSSRILTSISMRPNSIASFRVIERRRSYTCSFSKCSAGQSSARMSVGHGCRHLHDGAARPVGKTNVLQAGQRLMN